jgi:hypothetical protein
MRFRKETIEGKDDSINLSSKEQVAVSRLGNSKENAKTTGAILETLWWQLNRMLTDTRTQRACPVYIK